MTPWDSAAVAAQLDDILGALEAPTIDKVTRDMFCRWLDRHRRFPQIFLREGYSAEEQIVLTCRAILESKGNEGALIAPIASAVALCLRPKWTSTVRWVEVFDEIPLVATLTTLVDLFGEKVGPQHLAGVLRRKLWHIFGPDAVPVAKPAKPAPKPRRSLTRVPGVEKNIRLGLELLALRSTIKSNYAFGRQVRRQFDIDGQHACEVMKVARAYGTRPEIFTRLSWNALLHLASPALPVTAREALERRILAGERVGAPEIRAARLAHAKPDQPTPRMAA